MKRNRRLLSVLFCTIVVMFGSLLAAAPAQATSTYDTVVTSTDMIMHQGNCTRDISTSYAALINDSSRWVNATYQATVAAEFADALDDEAGWAVVKVAYKGEFQNSAHDGTPLVADANSIRLLIAAGGSASFANSSIYGKSLMFDGNPWIVQYEFDSNSSPCQLMIREAWHASSSDAVLANEDASTPTWAGYMHMRPVFVNVPVTYPSGYEGEETASEYVPLPPKYVAMGDSFSSGEGNPPFESGTDESTNECHHSPDAYPRLLQNDAGLDLASMAFVACSGATMTSVTSGNSGGGNWDEGPQTDALSEDTEVVTITIGGNDVGFKNYLTICGVGFCGVGTSAYTTITDGISDPDFTVALESTYEAILEKAPSAELYVMDYPYITADNAGFCGVFDFTAGREVQTMLNSTIKAATIDVRFADPDYYDRLHYVDTNAVGSPFEHKQICDGMSSDFGFTTFHPNIQGHIDYASVVASEIS